MDPPYEIAPLVSPTVDRVSPLTALVTAALERNDFELLTDTLTFVAEVAPLALEVLKSLALQAYAPMCKMLSDPPKEFDTILPILRTLLVILIAALQSVKDAFVMDKLMLLAVVAPEALVLLPADSCSVAQYTCAPTYMTLVDPPKLVTPYAPL
jgi:hypothetical protein